MQNEKNNTTDRELNISRLLNAPIELVWEVWTNPKHIKNWWGPNGFTNTITKMKVEPGGEWDLVMHGPDGTDYKNKSIYKEIVKHKKIVYEHISGPKFLATIEFESRYMFVNYLFMFNYFLVNTFVFIISSIRTVHHQIPFTTGFYLHFC